MDAQIEKVIAETDKGFEQVCCGLTWENRRSAATHARHVCIEAKRHPRHRCYCGQSKPNPHPECFDGQRDEYAELRQGIERLVNLWEIECGTGYVWNTEDVVDFVDCNIAKLRSLASDGATEKENNNAL